MSLDYNKMQFENLYGSYASNYNLIDSFGKKKSKISTPLYTGFILVILTIISFSSSKDEYDINNKKKEKTNFKKFLSIISWILLIATIYSFSYYGYLYFVLYLPQYNMWLNNLPNEAKKALKNLEEIKDNLELPTIDYLTYHNIIR